MCNQNLDPMNTGSLTNSLTDISHNDPALCVLKTTQIHLYIFLVLISLIKDCKFEHFTQHNLNFHHMK